MIEEHILQEEQTKKFCPKQQFSDKMAFFNKASVARKDLFCAAFFKDRATFKWTPFFAYLRKKVAINHCRFSFFQPWKRGLFNLHSIFLQFFSVSEANLSKSANTFLLDPRKRKRKTSCRRKKNCMQTFVSFRRKSRTKTEKKSSKNCENGVISSEMKKICSVTWKSSIIIKCHQEYFVKSYEN